jgi:perosamine synthetase
MYALGIGPGDEVIVPAMTFAATANCVVFQGGTPVFADVAGDTLLIDPASAEALITPRTKAIVAVDYAGQPCDYDRLRSIAAKHQVALVADACHSLGATYRGGRAGSLADISAFSFHPVKPITTGEGGAVTTNDPDLARRARLFRNHGITSDHRQRDREGTWFYEMIDLGYNYRLTDIQCVLGLSQLKKLDRWVARRRAIARKYDEAFAWLNTVLPLSVKPDVAHAYHLYVVRWRPGDSPVDRAEAFRRFRAAGMGVNVHYVPVHLHPFYRAKFGTGPGMCPVAEDAYREILSLPVFPQMSDSDVGRVVTEVMRVACDSQWSTCRQAA